MQKDFHCTYCGNPYAVDAGWPRTCPSCGNRSYRNPLPVVVAMVPMGNGLVGVRRNIEPSRGRLTLPGGYLDCDETWQEGASRELLEETGVSTGIQRLVGVYSAPDRDPRRHNVSVAFLMQPSGQTPQGGDDAASAAYVANWRDADLAFDHRRIVEDGWKIWSAMNAPSATTL